MGTNIEKIEDFRYVMIMESGIYIDKCLVDCEQLFREPFWSTLTKKCLCNIRFLELPGNEDICFLE